MSSQYQLPSYQHSKQNGTFPKMLAGIRAPYGRDLSLLVTVSPCSPPTTYRQLFKIHVAHDSSDSALDQLRALPKEHCPVMPLWGHLQQQAAFSQARYSGRQAGQGGEV